MDILRSLLFVPAISEKMLNKIDSLRPDAFILDLEDSVPGSLKESARNNVSRKLKGINSEKPQDIFIRVNELGSGDIYKDIGETIDSKISGYMIPKFEDVGKVEEIIKYISGKEEEKEITAGSIKLILMVESSKGLLELGKIETIAERLLALTLGWEDYYSNFSIFSEISPDILDFVRRNILINAKARNLLAIDTVYKSFKDFSGLKEETDRIVKMGFDGKLVIHPGQIEIINTSFTPTKEEIERMEVILENKDRIEKEGAISINGIMYDPPHLRWAQKVKDYLDRIK